MSAKTIAGTVLVVLLLYYSPEAAPQKPTPKQWKPAVYHGLVMGKSTRRDAMRALGKPVWVGHESDTGTPMADFAITDPVPGKLSVYFSERDIVTGMGLYPKKAMTEDEVIRLLGPNYTIGLYATDDCLSGDLDLIGGPMYETPEGHIRQVEYRERGLAVTFHDHEAISIEFVHGQEPFGPTESRCKGQQKAKSTKP